MEHNYLIHHGILGQKWGKKNGPPYPLALSAHSASERKHMNSSDVSGAIKTGTQAAKAGIDTYEGIRKTISQKDNYEKAKEMSDEELAAAIKRLEMEQRFVDLTSKDISKGSEYIKTAVETTAAAATFVVATTKAIEMIRKVTGK